MYYETLSKSHCIVYRVYNIHCIEQELLIRIVDKMEKGTTCYSFFYSIRIIIITI